MNIKILKFSGDWCGPCKILAQTLKNEENIINVDIEKEQETARKYNVRKIPTLIFLKDEKEVHRVTGNMPLKTFHLILDEIKFSKELNN